MAKTKVSRKKNTNVAKQDDSAYFLKLVLYLIIGSLWLRIENFPDWQIPLPLGLAIGLWYASHDHFKIDRKIEYALLLVSTFVSFWLPIGITVSL